MGGLFYEILVVPVASLLKWGDYEDISYLCIDSDCANDIIAGIGDMIPRRDDITVIVVAGLYGVEQFYDDDFYVELAKAIVSLADMAPSPIHGSYIVVYDSGNGILKKVFEPERLTPLMDKPGRFIELRWLVLPLVAVGSEDSIRGFVEDLFEVGNEESSDKLVDALKKHLGHKLVYALPPMPAEDGLEAIVEAQEAITSFLGQRKEVN